MFLGKSGRLIADITETCNLEELEGYLAAIVKAFHSLNHNFLITAVEHYGFCCNFIDLIKILQRNPKSYVINVGHTTKYFRLERGARQGDAIIRKNFMVLFYGWGSTASRLEPLRGGSLLLTTKFPEIPGTHFIDLGRMKGWVDLGAT